MEKILVATQASQINPNLLDFACHFAKYVKPGAAALIPNGEEESKIRINGKSHLEAFVSTDGPERKHGIKIPEENILSFEENCRMRGISCSTCFDHGIPFYEILTES